jgi:hypothetical protein
MKTQQTPIPIIAFGPLSYQNISVKFRAANYVIFKTSNPSVKTCTQEKPQKAV